MLHGFGLSLNLVVCTPQIILLQEFLLFWDIYLFVFIVCLFTFSEAGV
jgi:hypothetical protein